MYRYSGGLTDRSTFSRIDFWVTTTFHYEQPQVTHLNEMVVIVYTDAETFHAGTTHELNTLLSNSRGVAGAIDIEAVDENNDGRTEEITVNIGLTGVQPADIKSVVVVQSINYGIEVGKFASSICVLERFRPDTSFVVA